MNIAAQSYRNPMPAPIADSREATTARRYAAIARIAARAPVGADEAEPLARSIGRQHS